MHRRVQPTATLSVVYGTNDLFANQTLINAFAQKNITLTPDCRSWCFGGIHYFEDPTTVITNEAHDYIQYELTHTAHAVTPGGSDYAVVEGVSTSGSTPAVTDTYAGGGPCSTGVINNGGVGFNTIAGTTTPGTPSAGSVTWTTATTFTASGAGLASVQVGCLLTHVVGSGTPYIFAEGTMGPFSFVSGNTLTLTWQITAT